MKRLRTQALTLFARATAATETLAAEMKGAIPLWPEGAPGALGIIPSARRLVRHRAGEF